VKRGAGKYPSVYSRFQKMNRPVLLLVFILLHCLFGHSQGLATIRGTIHGATGYKARLIVWTDQVTYAEKQIARSDIDSSGRFNLIIDPGLYKYAFIDIGNLRAPILLEKGKSYFLQFKDYPSNQYLETRNLFIQNEGLEYQIINAVSEDPNLLIPEINKVYSGFLSKHYIDIYKKRTEVINQFIDTFFLNFGSCRHPFIREMVDYRIAMLKYSGYKVSLDQACQLWINGSDILYDHPDFMEFFNQLFDQYLSTRLKHYTFNELKSLVNDQGSYFMLSELMGRDTILINEQLREMVMVKSLGQLYHNKEFNKQQILKILTFISTSSKFPEHRLMAQNLLHLLTRFNQGKAAPDFILPDIKGNRRSLADFKGKYLYLVFFNSRCLPCMSELKVLESYYKELSDKLEVVVIGLDPDSVKFNKSMQAYHFPWPVLFFDYDFDLTDRYQIRNYPVFILINPEGLIEIFEARKPSEQFREWFKEMYMKDE
jgi:peroxiredoxin